MLKRLIDIFPFSDDCIAGLTRFLSLIYSTLECPYMSMFYLSKYMNAL